MCECVCLCWESHLCGGFRAGEGSQSPDDVESGQRAGGEEGAGQHHEIPLNHLQAGLPHGHPECNCVHGRGVGEKKKAYSDLMKS